MSEPRASAGTLPSAEIRQGSAVLALSEDDIARRLSGLPGWEPVPVGPGLARRFYFSSALEAAEFAFFAAGLFELGEVAPDFEILRSTVAVRVASLRGVGAVSAADFDLVARFERRLELAR